MGDFRQLIREDIEAREQCERDFALLKLIRSDINAMKQDKRQHIRELGEALSVLQPSEVLAFQRSFCRRPEEL